MKFNGTNCGYRLGCRYIVPDRKFQIHLPPGKKGGTLFKSACRRVGLGEDVRKVVEEEVWYEIF